MTIGESELAVIGWQTIGAAISKLRVAVVEDAHPADQLLADTTLSPAKPVFKTQASNAFACRKERERLHQLLENLTSGDVFPKYVTLLSSLVEVSQPAWRDYQHLWGDYASLRQLITQAHDLCLSCKSTRKWDMLRRAQHTQQLAAVRTALERFGDPTRLEEARTALAAAEQRCCIPTAAVDLITHHGSKTGGKDGGSAAAAAAAVPPAMPDLFVDFHGLVPDAEAAAKRSRRLGVTGIAGSGKTAIIRRVFDRIRGRFAGCSVLLTVGRDPDTLALLQHAAAVVLPDTILNFTTAEEGRVEIARELARQELHALLVLDDVWQQEHIAMLDFATACASAHQDSRLLITTRHERTLQHADGRPLLPELAMLRVPMLGDADAAALLRAHALPPLAAAEPDGAAPGSAERLLQSLVSACVPVPLALQQVGAALRGRSASVWGDVLRRLEEHDGIDTCADIEATLTLQCKLSFDMLSPALQECFLHWAAYPGGARVPDDELQALWAAQAPLPCDEAYARATMQMHELLRRRLIARDAGSLCSVHDILLQIVCAEAAARGSFTYPRGAAAEAQDDGAAAAGSGSRRVRPGTVAPERSTSLTARARSLWPRRRSEDETAVLHVSVPRGGVLSAVVPSAKAGSVRTLLHLRCTGDPGLSEALTCGALRFLSLAGGSFDALPDAIGDLRMLEVLILRGCKLLPELPERLGDCTELRVIDVAACRALCVLPGRFTELAALRRLVVRDCPQLVAPAAVAGLTALRTLCAARCGALSELPADVGGLSQLHRLDVSYCRALKGLPEELGGAEKVEVLHLGGCTRLATLPRRLGDMKSLRELNLSGCIGISHLPETVGDCASLQTLTLRECKAVAALPERLGGATRLQSLDVSGCTALTQLPERLGGLSHLEVLDASRCEALCALPARVGDCGRLRVLRLAECTALTALPARIGELKLLQELDLEQCEGVTALPETFTGLAQLRVLNLKWCKGMVALPEDLGRLQELQNLNLERCYSLLSLPDSICDLAKLTSLNMKWCKALVSLPERLSELRQLQVLNLTWCKHLKALPEDVSTMGELRMLALERCYGLSSLPESVCKLTGLTALNLKWCKGLTELPQGLGSLPELKSLNIMQCGALGPGEVVRAQKAVPSSCVVEADSSALLPQE